MEGIHEEGIWDFKLLKNDLIISTGPDKTLKFTEFKSGKVLKSLETDLESGYTISIND